MEVSMKKGMTLVEVLVSLTILMILLGAIFSILNMQQTKAINVKETTVLQTDANVALTLFRWDLFMAGYGIGPEDTSIISNDGGGFNNSDVINLRGAGLAFESSDANWSPILEGGSNLTAIKVYRFADSKTHFTTGDILIIVDQNKHVLEDSVVVTDTAWITYTSGNRTVDALELQIDPAINIGQGTIAFKANRNTYFNGVTYAVNGQQQLMRNNDVFLDNIEELQIAYGVDLDNNGTFEPSEWFNDLSAIVGYMPRTLFAHKSVIRTSFVVMTAHGLKDYTFTGNIALENNSYAPSGLDARRKREIVSAITWPRNIRL
jgi:type IV pilus assembly protein PilW